MFVSIDDLEKDLDREGISVAEWSGISLGVDSAKECLRQKIGGLRDKANYLEAIANLLPETLPADANEGLLQLLYGECGD
jgi:hypothetical protein